MTNRIYQFIFFFIVVSGFLALSEERGYSQGPPDEGCLVLILKETPQVESETFDFIFNLNGVPSDVSIVSNDAPEDVLLDQGDTLTVTERPKDGWVLEDVECFLPFNVEATKVEGGVELICPEGTESGFAICGFINRISPDKIPTLSEWGMISVAAGLGMIGVFFAVRRKKMQDAQ